MSKDDSQLTSLDYLAMESTRLEEYSALMNWTCTICGMRLPWIVSDCTKCKPQKKVTITLELPDHSQLTCDSHLAGERE